MDDRHFDKQSAVDWIEVIESSPVSKRDHDLYPKLNSWIANTRVRDILDLGCGQGSISSKLNLEDIKFRGVDPSRHLISRAKELYPHLSDSFAIGNIYNLPFGDEEFDGVFSIAVWHLLSDLSLASRELARVLKPEGNFFIFTANNEYLEDWTASYDLVEKKEVKVIGKDSQNNIKDIIYLYLNTRL